MPWGNTILRTVDGFGEACKSAIEAGTWQGAGVGNSSGNGATEVASPRRKGRCDSILKRMIMAHCSAFLPSIDGAKLYQANDAARRPTAYLRDSRSVAAADTKPQGRAAS